MLTNGHELVFFLPSSEKRLAGKGHRHAAWQKDNEAFIRNSGMKLSCLRSAGWKNHFLHSCLFVSIRGPNSFFLIANSCHNFIPESGRFSHCFIMIRKQAGITLVFLAFAALILSGCASSIMHQVEPVSFESTSKKVLVTFIRPSSFGGAIQFGIWDSEKFVGVLSAASYIQYLTEPGEHVFLARAENWSYVKADLAGGKRYYILGKVFPGFWKARVALDPVNTGDKESDKVDTWLNNLTSTSVLPEKHDTYVTPRIEQVREAVSEIDNGKTKYMTLHKTCGK